jgi:hypothetical protein
LVVQWIFSGDKDESFGLKCFYAIQGYDWLKPQRPMSCHWANKTMEIEDAGGKVFL